MHRNYWEHEDFDWPPAPRDARGRTIIPTQAAIEEAIAKVKQIQAEHEAKRAEQDADRSWDQR